MWSATAPLLSLTDPQRRLLLDLARASISHGLANGGPLRPDPEDFEEPLRRPLAVFVTLRLAAELRGCIGATAPIYTLVEDTAQHAYSAAFRDPRFSPLTRHEYDRLDISLSILSPPEPMRVVDEADLLRQLRPGVDGLILEAGDRRATFLPSVWDALPDRAEFVRQLKKKAGFPPRGWPAGMACSRYTAESV